MVIDKHGYLWGKRFKCAVCGCEFTLETHDTDQLIYPPYVEYTVQDILAKCPECGHGAEQEKI